ncbi:Hypothetical protein ORPV_842 [Orpheovirus IHUMI-LCC2]|uniref:Uncharacterized protein n=1 Tax=Orpheovirus IHUMI-LCC2 TaxID=2023057 RepID=A0A2I2L5E9_9VIRU|nr:Hypothetical protein ORPV_842 [Orpheovirus IHUMI-LCC2]SNW62746.1 Hypothetical protein ORPV_842 [Orpheovirus IHUMI-LCC2]
MFIVQYYVSEENSWERPTTISSIVYNAEAATVQLEAHIKKEFPSSKCILVGIEKIEGEDDMKEKEKEFDKKIDEIGHKEIIYITNRLRENVISLPKNRVKDARSVYCQLFFNKQKYYVMCPVDLYQAIRNTYLDYYHGEDIMEGINKMTEYDNMVYVDRGLYVRLCKEEEMETQTKIKVQDILAAWDGKVRDADIPYIKVLQDNFNKYSSYRLQTLE